MSLFSGASNENDCTMHHLTKDRMHSFSHAKPRRPSRVKLHYLPNNLATLATSTTRGAHLDMVDRLHACRRLAELHEVD